MRLIITIVYHVHVIITVVCFGKIKDSYNLVLCGLRKKNKEDEKICKTLCRTDWFIFRVSAD